MYSEEADSDSADDEECTGAPFEAPWRRFGHDEGGCMREKLQLWCGEDC